ncbi:MAG: CDP-diacylglycerol--glycerol-3-phosphate 3-phosphatidyltransferase [Deltaproteobacteria bacterium]|jgi:CDP-diacylglycerol--glycerol-3-phosphate 3-phosphatidyltransferase|nr:CDP-diacylglycerol--glycerol-3-phosphate 3-phosphatidyltransferase [Deltaproteobacteria bacterium]
MRSSIKRALSAPRLPNILTLGRIAAVLAVILGLRLGDGGKTVCAAVALVYLAAALSDLLDGYLARRFQNESNVGRFLDPMADKLLVASALIMLIPLGRVEAWVAFLIIAREIAVTGLRAVAVERGLIISASAEGKQKTLAQNIALFCLLYHYRLFGADAHLVGTVILYVALASTYWSGFLYFHRFLKEDAFKGGSEKAAPPEAEEAAPPPEAAEKAASRESGVKSPPPDEDGPGGAGDGAGAKLEKG